MRTYQQLVQALLRIDRDRLHIGELTNQVLEEEDISENQLPTRLAQDLPPRSDGIKRGYLQQCRSLTFAAPELQAAYQRDDFDWGALRGLFRTFGDKYQHDHDAERVALANALEVQTRLGRRLRERETKDL